MALQGGPPGKKLPPGARPTIGMIGTPIYPPAQKEEIPKKEEKVSEKQVDVDDGLVRRPAMKAGRRPPSRVKK